MKKFIVVFLFVLAGIALGLMAMQLQDNKYAAVKSVKNLQEQPLKKETGVKTVISNENNVEVSVGPPVLENGKLISDVAFNTHSVELNFNPKEISFIRSESQKETPAVSWEGLEESGHHRSGRLIFPAIPGKNLTVIIKNVAGVKERIFDFNI